MTLQCQVVDLAGGASPGTFDAATDVVLADNARSLVQIITAGSNSIQTVNEGTGVAVRLTSSSNWNGNNDIPVGAIAPSGEAIQSAALYPQELTNLVQMVSPNSTITVAQTTIGGATQTGTADMTVGLVTDDGTTPRDILQAAEYGAIVRFKQSVGTGGDPVDATDAETALTPFVIPGWAKEIIAGKVILTVDGNPVVSQEMHGHVRIDYGVSAQGFQSWPTNGGTPGLGTTTTSGGGGMEAPWIPMHIKLPGREITVRSFANIENIAGGRVIIYLAFR